MIERKLRYRFKDPALLETALAHGSCADEFSRGSGERPEFPGDAVLGCAVSLILHDRFPSPSASALSKIGARVASGAGLRGYARETGPDGRARLGRGEEGSGGREKDSIPAGAFEALPARRTSTRAARRFSGRRPRWSPTRSKKAISPPPPGRNRGKSCGARKTASGSFHPRGASAA